MVTTVVDTDYSRWAVLAQCIKNDSGPPSFLSSRILSRSRSLSSADMDRARAAIRYVFTNSHKMSIKPIFGNRDFKQKIFTHTSIIDGAIVRLYECQIY